MNEKIKNAIRAAVQEEQQSAELANKILAWIQSLTEGSEDVANPAAYTERCALCFDNTVIPSKIEE